MTQISEPRPQDSKHSTLAILAGAGRAPLDVANAARRDGREVHVVGLDGVADAAIDDGSHDYVGLGQVGRLLHCLRRTGARELIIIGALRRPDVWRVRVDWGFVRHIGVIAGIMRGGDDAVLRRVIGFFEANGLRVVGVGDAAPELLAVEGRIAGPEPDLDVQTARQRGREALDAMSAFDIGQACIACPAGVLAFEDGAGTADLISRYASRTNQHRAPAVLVKLPKRGQDLRIDLPAIGPDTIAQAAEAGLRAIFVAAGAAVVLDRPALERAADAAGISVYGIPWVQETNAGRVEPKASLDRSDAERGREIVMAMAPHLVDDMRDIGVLVRGGHAFALLRDGLSDLLWPQRLERLSPRSRLGAWPVREGALVVLQREPLSRPANAEATRGVAKLGSRKRLKDVDIISETPAGTASTEVGGGETDV